MTVVARFEVIPASEGSMSDAVASAVAALEAFEVNYETTPTDTVIEADDLSEVFDAVEAAHRAVAGDRVITSVEIDDDRTRDRPREDRVASVERRLGHPAKRERQKSAESGDAVASATGDRRAAGGPDRYGGPRRSRTPTAEPPRHVRDAGAPQTEPRRTGSRYLRTTSPRSD